MLANGRWDLISRLKGLIVLSIFLRIEYMQQDMFWLLEEKNLWIFERFSANTNFTALFS